jgi:hypothetical protein
LGTRERACARLARAHAFALARQIRRMDLEARSLPVSVKTPLLTKLRDYKARARRAAAFSCAQTLGSARVALTPLPCCSPGRPT